MSHEELAGAQARNAKRRKVEFRTTLEDLEGRLLLSSARALRPRQAVPLVRQLGQAQGQGSTARLKAQALQRAAVAAARQQQAAARMGAMGGMRMRGGFRVNMNPIINVNPTINVGGPTSNSASNPNVNVPVNATPSGGSTTTTPPSSQTAPAATNPATSTTPTHTTPPSTTPPTTTTPSNPGKPTTPRPGGGGWTDVTRPGGTTPKPTTPANPGNPKPADPTPTTPANPKPTTPTPANPKPADPAPTTPTTPTTPSKPAPTFPDGTILRDEQTGELGYYSQGKRGLISPPVAAKMGLTAEQTKAVPTDDFQAVPKGADYYPDGMFVRNDQTGEISRYSGGRFHVVSTPVLAYLGIGVDAVATIPSAQYGNTPKGDDYFPENLLIQNQQSGEVDIYQGGQRHWISVPVATRLNLQASQFVVISPAQFNGVPQGKDYFPEGVYLQNQDSGEISRFESGKLRLVSSPVASRLGLTTSDLISVSPSQYKAVEKGADYFADGMFLKNNQTGELANYSGGQRHWISSPVATQINLTDAMVTTIGADQFNAIPRGGDYAPPPPVATDPTAAGQD